MIASIWTWLNENGTALGIILTLIPIAWVSYQYVLIKKEEERRVKFSTFHTLVKQLVERESADQPMKLDRQIAVIYELRNFKEYFPVTSRILTGLREDWGPTYGPPDKRKRLIDEIDLTLEYIKKSG
jgi:hypothetical protein